MDLTEAENINKRWLLFVQKNYTKIILMTQIAGHNGVITHLEPDILEWKVKWALGSITENKASRGDGIPAELFQILR